MPIFTPSDWSDRKKWLMAIAGTVIAGFIVALAVSIPGFFENRLAVLSIYDTMQFRTWLGYRDNNQQEISRIQRFEGPLGVILTPIINNSSGDNSIFVEQIQLTISSPQISYHFTPLFTTNIHPEGPKEQWLAIQDDFTPFSVNTGTSWNKDLAFISNGDVSYNQFIQSALGSSDDLAATLAIILRDDEPLDATCQVSGEQLSQDIGNVFATENKFPTYVEIGCKAPQGDHQ